VQVLQLLPPPGFCRIRRLRNERGTGIGGVH
jgi:hypothetical protein